MKKLMVTGMGWLVLSMFCASTQAQDAPGGAARMVLIQPKEGMQEQFESGYKRHLAWHRHNNDSWTWFGWQVVSGQQFGYFMDGTFGHDWKDFDEAVDPAGDRADNAANVLPFAEFKSLSHFLLLADVSGQRLLEAGTPSRFLELRTYQVVPGQEGRFEKLLKRVHRLRRQHKRSSRYSWYVRVNGGTRPAFLLMLPAGRQADLQHLVDAWFEFPAGTLSSQESRMLSTEVEATVRDIRSATLVYRPDLSYLPGPR